jgi:hypothetical protein
VPRSERRHPDEPTLEEVLRPLRDRYRFLEDHFLLQADAAFADCDTEMSVDGLIGLTEICREGADQLEHLIDVLPEGLIDARVPMAAVAMRKTRTSPRTRGVPE